MTCSCTGSSEGSIEEQSVEAEEEEEEDSCCWVCLEKENVQDLFYPCNCKLHRKCIRQWIAKVRRGCGAQLSTHSDLICLILSGCHFVLIAESIHSECS